MKFPVLHRVRTDPAKSWNLSHIFQAWNVLESDLDPGMSWKCELLVWEIFWWSFWM